MPKTNKHAEVKPSKYRTSLCEFYLRQEECPFGTRCAFAHGKQDLRTEERNVELLKATGLQRLDGVFPPVQTSCSAMTTENSLATLFPNTTPFRRQPVIVSLPCSSDMQLVEAYQEDTTLQETSLNKSGPVPTSSILSTDVQRARCRSKFSTSCSPEAPLMYRHNPYGLSTQYY